MIENIENYEDLVDDLYELLEDFDNVLQKFIEKRCIKVTHEEIGIDPRSDGELWISKCERFLIAKDVLDFYSGFGFIENQLVDSIGGYRIFDSEKIDRIYDHISKYLGNQEDEDE